MPISSAKSTTGAKLPLHFDLGFSFSDWGSLSLKVGTINKGFVISDINVVVTSPFDGGAEITVGDISGTANLVTSDEIFLNAEGSYSIETNMKYAALTDIKIYFVAGTPTTGSAIIYIYYS